MSRAYTTTTIDHASATDDGMAIILTFATPTGPLPIAYPVSDLPQLLALAVQAGGQAQSIAGRSLAPLSLECETAEAHQEQHGFLLLFQLTGGLDLPLVVSRLSAEQLRDQLVSSLAGKSFPPSGTKQ